MTAEAQDFVQTIPLWIDVVAVSVGAASGSLTAAARRYDLSGIVALGIATGLGGGIVRDVLIQAGPPIALTEPALLLTAVVMSLVVFVLAGTVERPLANVRLWIDWSDAAVLGVFTIVGAARGLEAGLPALSCILLGVVTGVGGGLLRDVVIRQEPEFLRPGTLYALAGTIGASVYVVLVRVGNQSRWVGVACIALIILVRALAMWRDWTSPEPRDLYARTRRRAPGDRAVRRYRRRGAG